MTEFIWPGNRILSLHTRGLLFLMWSWERKLSQGKDHSKFKRTLFPNFIAVEAWKTQKQPNWKGKKIDYKKPDKVLLLSISTPLYAVSHKTKPILQDMGWVCDAKSNSSSSPAYCVVLGAPFPADLGLLPRIGIICFIHLNMLRRVQHTIGLWGLRNELIMHPANGPGGGQCCAEVCGNIGGHVEGAVMQIGDHEVSTGVWSLSWVFEGE